MTAPYQPPLMAATQVARNGPWLLGLAAQLGDGHSRKGVVMQDASAIGVHDNCSWLIVSDGMSKSELADKGSLLAVSELSRFIGDSLKGGALPSCPMLKSGFAAAHGAIRKLADAERRPAHDYNATLAAVILDGERLFGASIGDSSILFSTTLPRNGEQVRRMTPLCPSTLPIESANASTTIASSRWADAVTLNERLIPDFDAVFLGSDGADGFFSVPKNRFSPHRLTQFMSHVSEMTNLAALSTTFAFYFNTEPAKDDDDRTILIALKLPDHLQSPAGKHQ